MRKHGKMLSILLAVLMLAGMLAACGGSPETTAAPTTKATEAKKTEAEKTEAETTAAEKTEAEKTEAETTAAETTEAEETDAPATEAPETEAPETEAAATEADETEAPVVADPDGADPDQLPRKETLYYNGEQWGPVNSMNPLANVPNNMLFEQSPAAGLFFFETLYMYNQNDGQIYPLLADGDYTEEDGVYTIKLKEAARWSDGEPVTAEDVVFSYEVNEFCSTGQAVAMEYISEIVALDEKTVQITADPDNYNPYKIIEYFPQLYILPKHQLGALVDSYDGDVEAIKNDYNEDAIGSGPYKPYHFDNTKVVFIRDDNYWGQDESMWGKLPAPKYIAHNLFSDNNAGSVAFQQGEVDMAQQFMPQVWKMWEDGLPVSTYLEEAPYYIGTGMPSAGFNVTRPGLDNATVRRAIAMAIDYDQIGEAAMSGYTLPMVPALINRTAPEEAMVDLDALKDLQWTGKQVDEANDLLDEAGIVDTDGDGIREVDGVNLVFQVECPAGWTDWNAALEIVAAAGKEIGMDLSTYFPEAAVYSDDIQTGNFDIAMVNYSAASVINPWLRVYQTLYSDGGANQDADRVFRNYSRYSNERVDELIDLIPTEADEDKLIEYYTELNEIYLTDVPTIPLMYRPTFFHTVNESVWTNFPEANDGRNIPPCILYQGYGIAGLYDLELVEP
ncbi:MAG: ABC transporter substrate-binding protein [Bacillota bacterium]|nr:ABC transporter substrate-binding protein [Bacillota bacterium]